MPAPAVYLRVSDPRQGRTTPLGPAAGPAARSAPRAGGADWRSSSRRARRPLPTNLLVALLALKRLEIAGCSVVFVNDPVDTLSPEGYMMFTIKASFAQLESRKKSARATLAGVDEGGGK